MPPFPPTTPQLLASHGCPKCMCTALTCCVPHLAHSSVFLPLFVCLFFKIPFIYSWETERERGRDTGRGRSRPHAGSPMQDLILGHQDHAPGRRQALIHWATQGSPPASFWTSFWPSPEFYSDTIFVLLRTSRLSRFLHLLYSRRFYIPLLMSMFNCLLTDPCQVCSDIKHELGNKSAHSPLSPFWRVSTGLGVCAIAMLGFTGALLSNYHKDTQVKKVQLEMVTAQRPNSLEAQELWLC